MTAEPEGEIVTTRTVIRDGDSSNPVEREFETNRRENPNPGANTVRRKP